MCPVRKWYSRACESSTKYEDLPNLRDEFEDALDRWAGEFGGRDDDAAAPEVREWLTRCVVKKDSAVFDDGQKVWYLHNLTAKKCMRMETCGERKTGRRTLVLPGREWATLHVVLLLYIVWTKPRTRRDLGPRATVPSLRWM